MAIKKQYRTWNKIPVEIRTNTNTGEVQVWTDSRITLIPGQLASSQAGKSWVVENKDLLTRNFNGANETSSTPQQVSKAFLTEGYKIFDNDRAAVLNNPDNYSSPQVAVINQKNFYNAKVPRVKNPVTQQQVSSQGQQSTQQTTATTQQPQPQTASQPVKPQPEGSTTAPGTTGTGSSGDSNVVPDGNGAQQNELPADPNNNNGKRNINSTGNGAPLLLRYPLSNLDEVGRELGIGYDFIKIQIKEYSPSLDPSIFGPNVETGDAINSVTNRNRSAGGKGNAIATIILPMMQAMSTSNSVDWGEDKANIFQLVGGAMAANFFSRVGNEGVNPQLLKDAFDRLLGVGGAFAKGSVQEKNAITGILAGYLVGAPNIATRATGKVINPNMEMLFSGPRLRTFNFQFDMTPRNKDESKQIRRIIKTFKKYMSPSKSATGAFLQSPKIFELEYIYNGNIQSGSGNQHPYLNKFKACALTEFNVNFTPDGSYMTYRDDGSMTKYSITMSFSEISPIFEGDYDGKDDMGF